MTDSVRERRRVLGLRNLRYPHALHLSRLAGAFVCAPCVATVLTAQIPRTLQLGPASARHSSEFTRISAIRELSDGRVLVIDAQERRLTAVDFTVGTTEDIGRSGRGPGEYRSLDRMYALAADSTLVPDSQGQRWLLLAGSRIAATLTGPEGIIGATGTALVGADARGKVFTRRAVSSGQAERGAERVAYYLLAADRKTLSVDTLATFFGPAVRVATRTVNGLQITTLGQSALTASDQVVVFPDGFAAVLRQDPYSVEWISKQGRRSPKRSLPWTRIKVDEAEKQAYAARLARESGRKAVVRPDLEFPEWIGPFQEGAALPGPDGSVVIRKSQTRAQPDNEYDVIDRSGRITAVIALAWNQRIVGFGADAVYVAVTDEDGVEHLQKHPKFR